ncbi:MAG: hypothetical protein JRJ69_16110, partial [Deltaproteobacteria bacterium]|nr:hypothetical protein [Deltaproteobacteria bacterium]
MSDNHSIEGLKEKRNVIRDRVEDAVLKQVSNILFRMQGKVTKKAWEKLLNIAEDLDKDGSFASAINAVRSAFETNHPYIQFLEIVAKKSPACRKKLISNFFLNAVFRGRQKREEFSRN